MLFWDLRACKFLESTMNSNRAVTLKVKLAPNPELPDARGKKKGWSFEWIWALVFMILGPGILISLHTLCTKASCKLEVPTLSQDLKTYYNQDAVLMYAGFWTVLKLLKFVPIGSVVNGQRMNGFAALVTLLSAVPALVHYKVPLGDVKEKYFFFMSTSIVISFTSALVFYILSRWENKTSLNSKGNTGNPIVDIFNGRTLSPKLLGFDVKLLCFRYSMIGLAILNVLMVTDSIVSSGGKANPSVILAAAFQVVYAMDAMFFEEYYFHSHDAMNSGFGWSLISSYLTFPFLPTLVTRYLLDRSPEVAWYYLVLIGLMNALGYIIYRSSESQRCEFAKDPSNPVLSHLETVSTAGNRKLIVSGWWGMVRHPNYLGELLIQWSWVLPAGCFLLCFFCSKDTIFLTQIFPFFYFVAAPDLILPYSRLPRRDRPGSLLPPCCHHPHAHGPLYSDQPEEQEVRLFFGFCQLKFFNLCCFRKYGNAWTSYSERVRSNIIPKVF